MVASGSVRQFAIMQRILVGSYGQPTNVMLISINDVIFAFER